MPVAMGNLLILKASAGSGKTYSLTNEYLKLIERDRDAFRHVLAVTFTNKATEEMKRRVIEELYKRSATNPVSKERLVNILHNYSSFSISTIDRFFQQTMRAFAREIGKSGSYNVELDDNMVLAEAIDMMIQELDKADSEELLNWLILFSSDAIENGKSWDVRGGINALAQQMFKEAFRVIKGEFADGAISKQALHVYMESLDRVKRDYEKELTDIAKDVFKIMNRHGLRSDSFNGGKTRSKFKFYDKIAIGDFSPQPLSLYPLSEDFTNWYAKSLRKGDPQLFDAIEAAYHEGLMDAVERTISLEKMWIEYNTAVVIKSNIYTLGILIDINANVQKFSKENNLMLLSETTEILNNIIDGSDTPFIYEKIGSRFDHFMLDEFQDTSLMQWSNFKPLIQNSLASGFKNLIVGDIKQSIYRWRGSEWTLLNSGLYKDFPKEGIDESELDYNWRSCENIVQFNNEFFTYAAEQCDLLLGEGENIAASIYSGSEQKVCDKNIGRGGHVKVRFIEGENKDWKDTVLDELPSQVAILHECGYEYKDISILVRVNNDGVLVVNKLIESGYPVISNESLLITSSPGVRKILSILRCINSPDDPVNKTIAEFEGVNLPALDSVERLPLYEICERVIADVSSGIEASESPYIQGFMDSIADYLTNKKPDLNSFLEWFDTKWDKLSLSSPDDQNAIRVMTVHKSKGLGMKAVILPFFDIELDHGKNPTIWCKPDREPFKQIPYLPVVYKKDLVNTIFASDYKNERQKAFIDNLNIAYVAFTRAKQELIIYAPAPKIEPDLSKRKESSSLSTILFNYTKGGLDEKLEANIGEWFPDNATRTNEATTYNDNFVSIPPGNRLRLSLRSREYFDKESKRNYGVIMHDILSRVYIEDDLTASVAKAVQSGELKRDEQSRILEYLSEMLVSVRDLNWFDGSLRSYNELEILSPGGAVSRPDRVLLGQDISFVIDFKFGELKNNSHLRQVAAYMSLVSKISNTAVKGFLWYLEENDIVEVIG